MSHEGDGPTSSLEEATHGDQRLPRRLAIVFGLVALTAFGSWFYGFGVLVAPMEAAGLPEQVVATTYGLGLFGAGLAAMLVGRWSDRVGASRPFLFGAGLTIVATLAVVAASSPWVFAVAAVATGTLIGGLGYYSLVHATITRLAPADRTRSITVNTLWGAFASPVFLPLMGWMSSTWSWQVAMLVANASVVVTFVAAGLVIPDDMPVADMPVDDAAGASQGGADGESASPSGESPSSTATGSPGRGWAWRGLITGRAGPVPLLAVVAMLGGATTSVVVLYQVPMMVQAGLALGVASTLAGARGLAQLIGRLPLPAVIGRFGSGTTFAWSLVLLAVATVLLPATGQVVAAVAFVVIGGVAIGSMTTVESIFASDVVPTAGIGTTLGVVSLARGVGGAAGPSIAGQVTAILDTRTPVLLASGVIALGTAALVVRVTRRHA